MASRSRTGCLTCRHRKLKCDEKSPICSQCDKASRTCIPSTGIVFRHQQNASMNQCDADEPDSLKSFYAYKNSFDKDSIWVKIPRRVTFVINPDPDVDIDPRDIYFGAPENLGAFLNRSYSDFQWNLPRQETSEHAHLDVMPSKETANIQPFEKQFTNNADKGDTQGLSAQAQSFHNFDSSPYPNKAASTGPANTQAPSLDYILNSSSAGISPPLENGSEQSHCIDYNDYNRRSPIVQNVEVERTHEMSFLLRHFAEVSGSYLDLFDRESYFTLCVPVKALTNPLLRHAAAAYAAQQLSRVKGRKAVWGGAATTQAYMERYPNIRSINWSYKATQHYDKAISLLMNSIKDGSGGHHEQEQHHEEDHDEDWHVSNPVDPSIVRGEKRKATADMVSPVSMSSADVSQIPHPRKKRKVSAGQVLSDEMAAAAVMLCDYEFLEAPGSAWSKHLNGTKSLLDLVENSMRSSMHIVPCNGATHILPCTGFSRAKQATFWDFARQDYLSAFINETHTRLDTDDLPLFREAGLLLDDDGWVRPSNTTASGHIEENSGVMKVDMISNALVWLGGKIVNYVFAADNGHNHDQNREEWDNLHHSHMEARWNQLQKELDVWRSGVPDTFEPCAELNPLELPEHHDVCDSVFPEVWFNDPMVASTMQHYHMAQMLLKINKPQDSKQGKIPFYKQLGSYKSTARNVEQHARAICGIASSRPTGTVRVHSVQPLYLAGQCLERPSERTELIRLLRAVEADTGWATEYRVQQLLQVWEDTGQIVSAQ